MEVSFGANERPVTDVTASATPVDNTQTQTPAVVAPDPTSAVPATTTGSLLGDKLPTLKDIILPRVNLVQNIGTLSEDHDSGSLLFDRRGVGRLSRPTCEGSFQLTEE